MGYKLLIVEDEEMDRIGLHLLLSNEFPDLEILEDAVNGIEFVKTAQKNRVDIAIVDIDMPGLSGIEAIRLLRKLGYVTKIIMNTAYGEFDYAVEALKLQVNDFVLKPIRRDKIIETVNRCIKELDEETAENDLNRNQSSILNNLVPIVSNEFIMSIILGSIKIENIPMYSTLIGIPLERGFILSSRPSLDSGFELQDSVGDNLLYSAFSNSIIQVCSGIIGEVHEGIVTAYIVYTEPAGTGDFRDWVYTLSKLILHNSKNNYGLDINIGVGSIKNNVTELHSSYQESLSALKHCGIGHTVFYEDLVDISSSDTASGLVDAYPVIINDALQFIRLNYQNDLSLEIIADSVGVSVSYLSRLFKQVMNVNYVDYLTQYRIKKAVELMKTHDYPVKQLSRLVGYRNHTYFYKLFKNIIGMTISEYRASINRENERL